MTDYNKSKNLVVGAELLPDQIVYRTAPTYSIGIAAGIGAYTEWSFPHGLPFTPLLIGTYSDDNFATSYDLGTGPFEYLTTYALYSYSVLAHVWADQTNVYIRAISHNIARTLTFHIIGLNPFFLPSPTYIDNPPVQDNLLFDTDYNFLKHYTLFSRVIHGDGTGNYVTADYTTPVSAPQTMLCFVKDGNNVSFGNTMNTIVNTGTTFACLTGPNFLRLGIGTTTVKDVTVIVKGYIDA